VFRMHGSAGVGGRGIKNRSITKILEFKNSCHGPLCHRSLFKWVGRASGNVLDLEVLQMPFNLTFSRVYVMHGFAGVVFNQYSSASDGGHTINMVYN
jgi:hypothetical protein